MQGGQQAAQTPVSTATANPVAGFPGAAQMAGYGQYQQYYGAQPGYPYPGYGYPGQPGAPQPPAPSDGK